MWVKNKIKLNYPPKKFFFFFFFNPTYFFMWFIALRILSAMKLHWHRSAYASHLGD